MFAEQFVVFCLELQLYAWGFGYEAYRDAVGEGMLPADAARVAEEAEAGALAQLKF